MGNSFQDQLLKAGLVNKKQVKKAKHDKRVQRKENDRPQQGAGAPEKRDKMADNQVLQAKREQDERNRELNRRRKEERLANERAAQVRQLIETNAIQLDPKGEAYYFAHDNRVKKVYASETEIKKLSGGQLAIVQWDDTYRAIPGKVAKQIAERDPKMLIVYHQ